MLVAKITAMNVLRLFLVLAATLLPLSAYALDPAEEQISSVPLKKALESLKDNKPAEALKALSEFRHDSTTVAQYHFVSGRLKLAEKKPLEAVEHFGKAYQYASKGELKEAALIERAETYVKMRYFYEARSSFNLFIKNYPASIILGRAYHGLAKSLAETGSLKEALAYYEKSGTAPDVLLAKANTLHRLGMTAEAAKVYASVLESGDSLVRESEESLFYLGENFRLSGKTADAQKYLALVKDPLYKPRADLSLGIVALQQGKSDAAVTAFSAVATTQDRESARQALLMMADMEFKAGKTVEAKAKLEEIRTKYPYGKTYEEAMLKLARLLRQEGSFEKAVHVLNELVFKSSVKKEALEEFEKLLSEVRVKDKDLFPKLWKTAGPMLLDASREKFLLDVAGDLKDSGKPFLDLMQYLAKYGTEAGKTKSTAALVEFYTEKKDRGRADEYLKKLKSMKNTAEELNRLEGRLAFLGRDYKTASEKLVQLKKLQAADIAMLGEIAAATRDYPRAIARYEKAVRESGGDARDYARLGDIMYELNRHNDALVYYRLAVGKEPNHDWALYRIGSLTEGPEAEEALKKLSGQDPMLARLAEARLMELDLTKKGVSSY
ncbi:MAG: tetratricopeptide repeat protein [Nitrospirae bacterium]|nr:tetratricopeptide repeat protein [Nitrospirota bacterium]